MWSLGVIVYQLLTGVKPFNGNVDKEVLQQIKSRRIDYNEILWSGISEEAMNFTKKLLQYEPWMRYSAMDALKDPWIQKYI